MNTTQDRMAQLQDLVDYLDRMIGDDPEPPASMAQRAEVAKWALDQIRQRNTLLSALEETLGVVKARTSPKWQRDFAEDVARWEAAIANAKGQVGAWLAARTREEQDAALREYHDSTEGGDLDPLTPRNQG